MRPLAGRTEQRDRLAVLDGVRHSAFHAMPVSSVDLSRVKKLLKRGPPVQRAKLWVLEFGQAHRPELCDHGLAP
jgi:hypothetical protein